MDSNPGPLDSRCRLNHGAMSSAQQKDLKAILAGQLFDTRGRSLGLVVTGGD